MIVDCRIGSLETERANNQSGGNVDCRIGSLEILDFRLRLPVDVDCRIGSLERILNKRDLRLYC